MHSGQRHEPAERIIIPKSEVGDRWKVHPDGLLEAADGRTVFPTYDPQDGRVIGSHSYYLSQTAVVVESVFKP